MWTIILGLAGAFFKSVLDRMVALAERAQLINQGRREQRGDDVGKTVKILERQRDAASAPPLDARGSRDRMRGRKP